MLNEGQAQQKVYLAAGPTDLRKSIDGLAALVQEGFHLNPFSPCVFAFCNRQRDKVKLLEWDTAGFWLHYRRLEKGRFQWPDKTRGDTVTLDRRELRWLLDGLSIQQPKAHRKVVVRTVI